MLLLPSLLLSRQWSSHIISIIGECVHGVLRPSECWHGFHDYLFSRSCVNNEVKKMRAENSWSRAQLYFRVCNSICSNLHWTGHSSERPRKTTSRKLNDQPLWECVQFFFFHFSLLYTLYIYMYVCECMCFSIARNRNIKLSPKSSFGRCVWSQFLHLLHSVTQLLSIYMYNLGLMYTHTYGLLSCIYLYCYVITQIHNIIMVYSILYI